MSVSSPDEWAGADVKLSFDGAGSLYQNAISGNTPNSALWGALPATEFDTFVTAPNFDGGNTQLLGLDHSRPRITCGLLLALPAIALRPECPSGSAGDESED